MPEDALAWETLSSRTAYTCAGFEVLNERVRLPDGTETEFDYLSEPESVVILPFTGDAREIARDPDGATVVVIQEWREAVGRVSRGLPAGGVEPGDDDVAATARRELTEETGYVADAVEHLVTVEPANGIADTVHNYFVAYGCVPSGDQQLDIDESIRVTTTTLGDLRTDIVAGDVRDGRTVTGVCYYQVQRR